MAEEERGKKKKEDERARYLIRSTEEKNRDAEVLLFLLPLRDVEGTETEGKRRYLTTSRRPAKEGKEGKKRRQAEREFCVAAEQERRGGEGGEGE